MNHYLYRSLGIIQESKGRDRTRLKPKVSHETIGRAKTQPRFSERLTDRGDIDTHIRIHEDEIVSCALAIAEEEIFDATADNIDHVGIRLLTGIDGRMFVIGIKNPDSIEVFEDGIFLGHSVELGDYCTDT